MKLIIKNFIECFSVIRIIPELLREEEGLGAHTSVKVFSPFVGFEYVWWHRDLRPLGDSISPQCPICHAVRTLTIGTEIAKPGMYSVSCVCGWEGKKQMGKLNLDLSATGGGIMGWGKRLLYGTPASFQTIWKAPRDFYFMF